MSEKVVNFCPLARPVRQETSQLTVPGAPEQKSSTTTGATPRKKKSIGIRALSAKQRKDDNIRALLKEHLGEIRTLLYLEKSVPVEVSCLKEPLASERIKELGLYFTFSVKVRSPR